MLSREKDVSNEGILFKNKGIHKDGVPAFWPGKLRLSFPQL